jgi:hypothetical protein
MKLPAKPLPTMITSASTSHYFGSPLLSTISYLWEFQVVEITTKSHPSHGVIVNIIESEKNLFFDNLISL